MLLQTEMVNNKTYMNKQILANSEYRDFDPLSNLDGADTFTFILIEDYSTILIEYSHASDHSSGNGCKWWKDEEATKGYGVDEGDYVERGYYEIEQNQLPIIVLELFESCDLQYISEKTTYAGVRRVAY